MKRSIDSARFGVIVACGLMTACARSSSPAAEAPVEIPSPAAAGSAEPNVVAGPDGRVYLTWVEPAADSAHALRWSVLDGGAWSAPATITQGRDWFVNWADFPSLLVLPDRRMAAFWLQRSGSGTYAYDVRVTRSADGGRTWTTGTVPHRDGLPAEHGFVALWPGAGDSVGIVWLDGRDHAGRPEGDPTAQTQLRMASIASDGTPGAEVQLDPRTCDCCQNAAAVTSEGPLVVYRDRSADEIRDIYTVRRSASGWTEPRPVHADGWRVDYCPVNGPAVAAEGRRAVVAWFTAADSTPRVNVAFSSDAGATWSAPVRVDGGNPSGRVDVELAPSGAVVSWLEEVAGGAEIRLRRIGENGTAGTPLTAAPSTAARKSGFPRMAVGGDEIVLAWTVPGEPSQVRTARIPLEAL